PRANRRFHGRQHLPLHELSEHHPRDRARRDATARSGEMKHDLEAIEVERYELVEPPRYVFSPSRRAFVQSVGAGLLITAIADWSFAQERGRDDQNQSAAGRFHIDKDGRITAFTGKVEV